jgi:hypothetical protein
MAVKMFIVPACGLQFFNTTDTLAYFCTEFIMSVKMFIVLACGPQSPHNNTGLTNTLAY